MEYFVEKNSVVREIWGKGDTVLYIFVGASAEFALNKAVDWLYFTGRLPADPLGRLFSTVAYARQIILLDKESALRAIDKMAAIHSGVEAKRGASIPDWAYRDVLFLLIDYSIRAFELLERPLLETEKAEVFDVFYRVGSRMGLKDLPTTFKDWQIMREEHLQQNLEKSHYTIDLYKQYRKQLGALKYKILTEAQIILVPERVNELLQLGNISLMAPVLKLYKFTRKINLAWLIKYLILPREYQQEIRALDYAPA